jgi:hypothetical protein
MEEIRAGPDRAGVLSRRGNRLVVRWKETASGDSIVVKMWSRPDLRGTLRRWLRIAPSDREHRNLVHLHRLGVSVPRALGVARLAPSIAGYTDALFTEDLGECETATERLKRLLRTGDERQALRLEDDVIDITRRLVEAGMLDEDHGMLNIVVPPSGQAVRLDLEIARRVFWPRLFPSSYGRMLGRLIGLHAFAVQPDVQRTSRFAQRLREALRPSPTMLERAAVHAREMMAEQLRGRGINTRLSLPWE